MIIQGIDIVPLRDPGDESQCLFVAATESEYEEIWNGSHKVVTLLVRQKKKPIYVFDKAAPFSKVFVLLSISFSKWYFILISPYFLIGRSSQERRANFCDSVGSVKMVGEEGTWKLMLSPESPCHSQPSAGAKMRVSHSGGTARSKVLNTAKSRKVFLVFLTHSSFNGLSITFSVHTNLFNTAAHKKQNKPISMIPFLLTSQLICGCAYELWKNEEERKRPGRSVNFRSRPPLIENWLWVP